MRPTSGTEAGLISNYLVSSFHVRSISGDSRSR